MNISKISTSACRYCRYYKPEGRRGGGCQMLGVPVQSDWKACALASPPFETNFLQLENMFDFETPLLKTPSLSSRQVNTDSKVSRQIMVGQTVAKP